MFDFRKFFQVGTPILALLIALCPVHGWSGDKIRLGVLPVLDTLPLIVAKEQKNFKKNGINLEIVNFQSALERDAALQAGELDGYFGDLLNTFLLIDSGQKIKIVTTVFHTSSVSRMFGIVAAPGSGITDFSGLKGKQVAISSATVIEYLCDRFMQYKKVPVDYVEKIDIRNIPIRLQMLVSGKIMAALLPEPLITLAESQGGVVIIDDRQLNTSLTVIALRAERLAQDTSFASRFLQAYDEAVSRINRDPENFKELLVMKTRFPINLKKRFLVPNFPEKKLPSPQDIAAVRKWLNQSRMLTGNPTYNDIILNVKR